MSDMSDSVFLAEDAPNDAGDSEPVDIGNAIDEAAKAVFGDGSGPDDAPSGTGGILDDPGDSSPGAIDQIGQAVREALDYAHDVDEDPPARTGPYAAGGPD